MSAYFGKYRGIVTDNNDPRRLGRIKVKCPAVLGANAISNWALPNLPPNYFSIPPVGATVWMEFELGAREKPIWTGMMYTAGDLRAVFGDSYDPSKVKIVSFGNMDLYSSKNINITSTEDLNLYSYRDLNLSYVGNYLLTDIGGA